MKLYFVPFTRASRPRWLLEELGVPYELVTLDPKAGDNKRPEYLAVHPLGAVPALVDGDVTIFESAAICMVLADKFAGTPRGRALAPALGTPTRAKYTQWMFYAMVTLEPAVIDCAAVSRARADGQPHPKTDEEARAAFARVAAPVEALLAGQPYLLGEGFTAADIPMGAVLAWARSLKLLDGLPALAAYVARLTERPAYRAARK